MALLGLAREDKHHKKSSRPGVVNTSFGLPQSNALDKAVKNMASEMLFMVTSDGNRNTNACSFSPAAATVDNPFFFSMAAHSRTGKPYSKTNFGKCADLSTPGVGIKSDSGFLTGGFGTGTSVAAPHVSGAIAVLLSDKKKVLKALTTGSRIIPRIKKPALRIDC